MSSTIIIHGTQGAGKTNGVKKALEGRKTVWLCPDIVATAGHFAFSEVEPDTEFIVLDGVGEISFFKWLIRADQILINKKGSEPFTMPRPALILISNYMDNTHLDIATSKIFP
nr:hypothetical protein [uncultured Draconibacterium sp.]